VAGCYLFDERHSERRTVNARVRQKGIVKNLRKKAG
jgi:hypothetical protein